MSKTTSTISAPDVNAPIMDTRPIQVSSQIAAIIEQYRHTLNSKQWSRAVPNVLRLYQSHEFSPDLASKYRQIFIDAQKEGAT